MHFADQSKDGDIYDDTDDDGGMDDGLDEDVE